MKPRQNQAQKSEKHRLRAVPIFPLEFVEPRKDIANAGTRKPKARQGKTREVRLVFPCLSFRVSTNSRGKIGTARSPEKQGTEF